MSDKVLIEYEVDSSGGLTKTREFRGEMDKLPASAKKASSGMKTLSTVVKAAGAAFAAAGVAQFVRGSTAAAAEQQKVFNDLASSMSRVGVSYNDVGRELQATLSALQETTRYGDTDTAATIQMLTNVTGSYDSALKLLNPTLDFATAAHIDLNTAARLVGQASTGMTGTLSRYGIVLSDTTKEALKHADAQGKVEIIAAELQKRFGGAAQDDMATYSAKTEQLANYFGDLQEVVGDVIIKTGAAPGVFDALKGAIIATMEAVKGLGEAMVFLANYDYAALWKVVWNEIQRVWSDSLSDLFDLIGAEKMAAKFRIVTEGLEGYGKYIERDLDNAFRTASDSANGFRAALENTTSAASKSVPVLEEVADAAAVKPESVAVSFAELSKQATYLNTIAAEAIASAASSMQTDLSDTEQISAALEKQVLDMAETNKAALDMMATDARGATDKIDESLGSTLGESLIENLNDLSRVWKDVWSDLASFANNKIAGVVSSRMSGAGAGGFFSSIAGTVVGGMVGLLISSISDYFGGDDSPKAWAFVSPSFSDVRSRGDGALSPEGGRTLGQNLTAIYQERVKQYRQILELFGDSSLFDMVGDLPMFSSGNDWSDMTADQLAKWLSDTWIPEALAEVFGPAFEAALGDLGADSDIMEQLGRELNSLPGDSRMRKLESFVRGLTGTVKLISDLQLDNMLEEIGKDSMQRFADGIGSVTRQIDIMLSGMDEMSLTQRGEQAERIVELGRQAYDSIINMLAQVRQMSEDISRSIAGQIEGIRLGGMSYPDQIKYIEDQIAALMGDLGSASSPESVSFLSGQIQDYVSQLQSLMGDNLYASLPNGQSWAEYLIDILEETDRLQREAVAGIEGQIDEERQRLVDQLGTTNDYLTAFDGSLSDIIDEFEEWTVRSDKWAESQEYVASAAMRAAEALERLAGAANTIVNRSAFAPASIG